MTSGQPWCRKFLYVASIASFVVGSSFGATAQPTNAISEPPGDASHQLTLQSFIKRFDVVQEGGNAAPELGGPQLSISVDRQRLRGALNDFLITDQHLEQQKVISKALGAVKVKPGADQEMIKLDLDLKLFDDRLHGESHLTTTRASLFEGGPSASAPKLRAEKPLDHGSDQQHRLQFDLWRGDQSNFSLSTAYGLIQPSYGHGWGRLDGDREHLQLGAEMGVRDWRLQLNSEMSAIGGDDYSQQGKRQAKHSTELSMLIGDSLTAAGVPGPWQPDRLTLSGTMKDTEGIDQERRPDLELGALFNGLAEPDKRQKTIGISLSWRQTNGNTKFGLGRIFAEATSEGQLHSAGYKDEVSVAQHYGNDDLEFSSKLSLQIGHDSGLRRGAALDTKLAWEPDDWPELNAGLKLVHQLKDARPADRNRLEFAASADFASLLRQSTHKIDRNAWRVETFLITTLRFKLGGAWAARGKYDHSDQMLLLIAGGWRF